MKQSTIKRITLAGGLSVLFCSSSPPVSLTALRTSEPQNQESRNNISPQHERALAAFDERVKKYVALRERLEGKLPKLSTESTPDQIQSHKTAFEGSVRAARAGAKPADVFSPDVAGYIRALIRQEFKGGERAELRETILEADTKGVPLRVNYSYPETKELTQIPPTLLLKLPQLPKQLKYRFVGRHMLLVDRENGLIIDYMLKALP